MYDRRLTMLALALLAATLVLYYADTERNFIPAFITGMTALGIMTYAFVRFNVKYLAGKR